MGKDFYTLRLVGKGIIEIDGHAIRWINALPIPVAINPYSQLASLPLAILAQRPKASLPVEAIGNKAWTTGWLCLATSL